VPRLAPLALALLFIALVGGACNTSDDAVTCPSGSPPVCFGSAQDTCYCTPVSTCAYCAALFNARPADPDPLCTAYRGNVTCTIDRECPAGEVCLTGDATTGGGVCDHACTATMLYLDAGPDAPSFGDSGLDATALTSFENACVSYYGNIVAGGDCATCEQSQLEVCAPDPDAGCGSGELQACATECKVATSATTAQCGCIAGCLASCAGMLGAYYECVAGACTESCL
jgi:hypothetical protein